MAVSCRFKVFKAASADKGSLAGMSCRLQVFKAVCRTRAA